MNSKGIKIGSILLLSAVAIIACQKEETQTEAQLETRQIETWKTIDDYPSEITVDNWEEFVYAPNHVIAHFEAMEAGERHAENNDRAEMEGFDIGKTPPGAIAGLIKFRHGDVDVEEPEYIPFPGVTITHCGNEAISFAAGGDPSAVINYAIESDCEGTTCMSVVPIDGVTELSCEISEGTSGVTTLDVVLIQKHILGLEIFESPSQYLAADVNRDGYITGADIVMVRKMILGHYDGDIWPISANYLFIDQGDYNYLQELLDETGDIASWILDIYGVPTPCLSSLTSLDRTGVKTGDVNGTLAHCF